VPWMVFMSEGLMEAARVRSRRALLGRVGEMEWVCRLDDGLVWDCWIRERGSKLTGGRRLARRIWRRRGLWLGCSRMVLTYIGCRSGAGGMRRVVVMRWAGGCTMLPF
jgi:hypothetical protein